jgi:hypothetical protein
MKNYRKPRLLCPEKKVFFWQIIVCLLILSSCVRIECPGTVSGVLRGTSF